MCMLNPPIKVYHKNTFLWLLEVLFSLAECSKVQDFYRKKDAWTDFKLLKCLERLQWTAKYPYDPMCLPPYEEERAETGNQNNYFSRSHIY